MKNYSNKKIMQSMWFIKLFFENITKNATLTGF
jgi:hypothetical protein